jgi:hypothetical protein
VRVSDHVAVKEILEAHGENVKRFLQEAFGPQKPTKAIVTAGDERVCPMCQVAEKDGTIPDEQPYSNGKAHPPFHGKTCRCQEITSKALSGALEIRGGETTVDVGFFDEWTAKAATEREYGSGNGPPAPTVRPELDTKADVLLGPLFDDLGALYKDKFMKG